MLKNVVFTFFVITLFFVYPFSLLTYSTAVQTEFDIYQESKKPKQKVSQNVINNEEYVEAFNEFHSDRYELDKTDGAQSYWNGTALNGLYSFEKTEYGFDTELNATISDTEYNLLLKCNEFTNASNEHCAYDKLSGSSVESGGYLTGWSDRKLLEIDGHDGVDLTDYNMEYFLYYGNGTDSSDNGYDGTHQTKIYLGNTSQTDFDDIRFTSSDGVTLLTTYLIDVNPSNYAQALVNVPSILRDDNVTSIYLYWGNSGVSGNFNSSKIEFFDTFDSGIVAGEWTTSSNVASVGAGTVNGDDGVHFDTDACTGSGCFAAINFDDVDGANQFSTTQNYKVYMKIYVQTVTLNDVNLYIYHQSRSPNSAGTRVQYDQSLGANLERPYNHQDNHFDPTTPAHIDWDDAGTYAVYGMKISYESDANFRYMKLYMNDTKYEHQQDDWEYIDPSSVNGELRYIHMNWQGYIDDADRFDAWLLEFAIVKREIYALNTTITNAPQTSGNFSVNYIGYLNNSLNITGGINRFFPAVNVSQLPDLQGTPNLDIVGFEYFYFRTAVTTTNLQNGSLIEFFIYNLTDINILNQTGFDAMSSFEIQEFWNISSLPKLQTQTYELGGNLTDLDNEIINFDLKNMSNWWLETRSSSETILGLGIQLYNLTQENNITDNPDTNFIVFDSTHVFDYEITVNLTDIAFQDLEVQVEARDELISTMNFIYENSTNTDHSTTNYFEYSIAIETFSGTLARTHYVKFIFYDPSGEVFVAWRTTGATEAIYSTGVYLEDQHSYRFTFDISKSDGRLAFSILNSTGGQLLRPTQWQSYTASDVDSRPSFFGVSPMQKYYDVNVSTDDHRRGYSILFRAGSTGVITGAMSVHLDQIFSSAGLLDTEFYCTVVDNVPSGQCLDYAVQDFDDVNALTAHWNNLSTTTRVTYQRTIRDFRHFSGILGFNSTDDFTNDQAVENIRMVAQVTPLDENGNDMDFLYISLVIGNYSGGYNVIGSANDNISIPFWYPDLPAGKPSVNFGFGFYAVDELTIGLTVKYFDTAISTTVPVTASTYGNYDDTLTSDVRLTIQYEIQFGNNINTDGGTMGIRESDIIYGRNRPFDIPSIPNPDVPFVPPNLWDNIVAGIGGFTDTLLSGDLFGALGGVFESFIFAIVGLGGLIVGALFEFVIPWVQVGLFAILDWFLDTFDWRSPFTTAQGIVIYIIDRLVLVWLFMVFMVSSFPFFYGLAGRRSDAPKRILDMYQKTWWFDIKMGILNAVLPRFPMILVATLATVYYATVYPDELGFVVNMLPFLEAT